MGAFQVRQFLLTSYAAERALLCAVAECFDDTSLLVTYNGKTFDVPVMETRWLFHRMQMPLDQVRHFDMLHPARRLWRGRARRRTPDDWRAAACRTLERALCAVTRVGDVPGMEIPARYFRFLRSGDARPLEPVLEHNRLDLVSLAAVTARALQLVDEGKASCRDAAEVLALGKVYERAGCRRSRDRLLSTRGDGFQRPRCRRPGGGSLSSRRCGCAASGASRTRRTSGASLLDSETGPAAPTPVFASLAQFAAEALAIHHEHRERDYEVARDSPVRSQRCRDEGEARLDRRPSAETSAAVASTARLERKLARKTTATCSVAVRNVAGRRLAR